jgi:MYXO-CTERM domain-containing protein
VPADDATPLLPLAAGAVAAVVALVVLRRRLVRSGR